MKVVNVQNAKTHLSRLLEEALGGEEIIIARAGKPLVRLAPFEKTATPRKLGALAGRVTESTDCWDPDPGLEAAFYGGDDAGALRVAEDAP